MRWLVVLLVACSAAPAATRTAAPPPVEAVSPPAAITCADAAVILRGKVTDERTAGPMKEEAIAKSCLHDKWSAEIVDCIGGTANAYACLDKLEQAQRAALRERLERWNDAFPDEVLDDAEDKVVDEDHLDYVDCAKAVGDPSQYAPVVTLKGEERDLSRALRKNHILALCEDWSTEARRCFEQQTAPERCRTLLEPDQKQALFDRIAEVDALMAKIAAAKAPACKKVVEVHYADAHWKGKLGAMKPGEKKKIIVESRKKMGESCTTDKWNASVRGCIVLGGGDACFVAAGMSAYTWGFPPTGIAIKTGIPECDAYADALRALVSCTQIPRQAAQTMLDAYQQTASALANLPAAQRTAAANSCQQADSAIRQSARSLGCTI